MRERARVCRQPGAEDRPASWRCSTSSSPGVDFQWLGVEDVAREEGHNKAKAVFRLFGRKLKTMGFEDLVPEEIVREGMKAEEITKLIEEDEDIGVLVLGASKDPSGPGTARHQSCRRQACRHLSRCRSRWYRAISPPRRFWLWPRTPLCWPVGPKSWAVGLP